MGGDWSPETVSSLIRERDNRIVDPPTVHRSWVDEKQQHPIPIDSALDTIDLQILLIGRLEVVQDVTRILPLDSKQERVFRPQE